MKSNKSTCSQCGGLLKGYYDFYTCSDCYSKNAMVAHLKKTRPEGATHKMRLPDSLETVYYKYSAGQWYIWSSIEKEPDHWIKAIGA